MHWKNHHQEGDLWEDFPLLPEQSDPLVLEAIGSQDLPTNSWPPLHLFADTSVGSSSQFRSHQQVVVCFLVSLGVTCSRRGFNPE